MKTESFACDGPYCIECGCCLACTDFCLQSANGEHVTATVAEVSEG